MKTAGILLLVLIFLGQTFRQPVIFINYQINKEVIIARYCENKAKPELKCNGKCHLKKQLNESSENEKPQSQKIEVQKINLIEGSDKIEIQSPLTGIVESTYSEKHLIDRTIEPPYRPPLA